ncbi:MAG: hypothetical protein ACRDIE_06500 [Chloroflexota bacterium]
MKGIRILMQPVGHYLISVLISKWGLPLLLLGMMILAGSTAVYLTLSNNPPAPIGGRRPAAATFVTTQCTASLLVVAPDIACNDR